MFEQTFVAGPARVRTGWSMLVSLTTQVGLVGVGLLVPLLNPELLPRSVAPWDIKIAPPPGRPPAPPPPETAPQPRAKAASSQVRNNALLAPPKIPQTIALIVDEPDTAPTGPIGPYVPGGLRCDDCVPNGTSPTFLAPTPAPPPTQAKPVEAAPKPVIRIRQGGDVQQGKLISQVTPKYPAIAVQTRTQGKVKFTAIISTQGQIMNLQLLEGHPLLTQAAAEAVRQWRYKPTTLNGDPVEVVTVIEVNFTLNR